MTLLAGSAPKRERVEARLKQLGILMWARQYCPTQGATLAECIGGDNEWRRTRSISRARHRLWAIIYESLGLSSPEMGDLFEVDHTSILFAVNRRRAELEAENGRAA